MGNRAAIKLRICSRRLLRQPSDTQRLELWGMDPIGRACLLADRPVRLMMDVKNPNLHTLFTGVASASSAVVA